MRYPKASFIPVSDSVTIFLPFCGSTMNIIIRMIKVNIELIHVKSNLNWIELAKDSQGTQDFDSYSTGAAKTTVVIGKMKAAGYRKITFNDGRIPMPNTIAVNAKIMGGK